MKKLRGFTLIELLIVVAIIAILAAIAVPNFLEAQTRSKVSRVRSDHRSLATAIETYYIDNNTYPAHTVQLARSMDWTFFPGGTATNFGATFRSHRPTAGDGRNYSITTPIAYITSNFPDPFADTRGIGFRYYNAAQSTDPTTVGTGWILASYGPNTDQSVGGNLGLQNAGTAKQSASTNKVETVYNARETQPSLLLLTGAGSNGSYTYDPSNGTISPGDVWRVKQ